MAIDFLFIQTGGTIDKLYPEVPGNRGFEIGDAAYRRVMQNARSTLRCRYTTVCRKDSQDLDPRDLQRLVTECYHSPARNIIITHGTDTMLKTAEYLHQHRNLIDNNSPKRIALVGAAVPEAMRDSDADINCGMAIGTLPHLRPGVYIAMSGRVLPWDKVARDEKGRFNPRR